MGHPLRRWKQRSERLDEAYRQSAKLTTAWPAAIRRAARRYQVHDVGAFSDAARDVGYYRLDGGVPSERYALDRLMREALSVYRARRHRRAQRSGQLAALAYVTEELLTKDLFPS